MATPKYWGRGVVQSDPSQPLETLAEKERQLQSNRVWNLVKDELTLLIDGFVSDALRRKDPMGDSELAKIVQVARDARLGAEYARGKADGSAGQAVALENFRRTVVRELDEWLAKRPRFL